MTYAAHHAEFPCYADPERTPAPAAAQQTGALRRLLAAVFESRQRRADKEIGRFIANAGGRLNDDLERRMMARLTRSDWSVRE